MEQTQPRYTDILYNITFPTPPPTREREDLGPFVILPICNKVLILQPELHVINIPNFALPKKRRNMTDISENVRNTIVYINWPLRNQTNSDELRRTQTNSVEFDELRRILINREKQLTEIQYAVHIQHTSIPSILAYLAYQQTIQNQANY